VNGVSLTEQMGAMALIDELRHNQQEVQKHLNLAQHRKVVGERIRAFYDAKGIPVEDALVEQGVRSYFASRFVYEAPPIAPLNKLLTRLYINRQQVMIWLPICLWSLYAWHQVVQQFGEQGNNAVQVQVRDARLLAESLPEQVQQLQLRLADLEASAATAKLPAASRLLEQARATLEKARRSTPITLPERVSSENRDADLERVAAATQGLKQDVRVLQAVAVQLNNVSQLLALGSTLNALVTADPFNAFSHSLPAVTDALAKARSALDQADTQGMPTAQAAIEQLDGLIGQVGAISPYLTQLQDAQNQLRKMGLSKADAESFRPLVATVDQAIKALDTGAAQRGLEALERLKVFAATPLRLEVVSRVGEKSMIERNYDPTDGKSWYLLTEAMDAAGNVVAVPITSSETGEKRYAEVFGVRVSQATYQEVKQDKLADGHVDNRRMGSKEANSLGFKFLKGRLNAKSDYILEW
jgi:hypothetical protein